MEATRIQTGISGKQCLLEANNDILSKKELTELGDAAYNQFSDLCFDGVNDGKVYKVTVDGVGSYSIELPKGEYSFIFVSNGRKRTNALEIMGRLIIEEVSISSGEKQNISVNFGL